MKAKRIDSNQKQLVQQLRKIPGVTVAHTHTIGSGFVDLVIGYKKKNFLIELKDSSLPPSRKRLTEDEKRFHDSWTGQVDVVETFEEVLKLINA